MARKRFALRSPIKLGRDGGGGGGHIFLCLLHLSITAYWGQDSQKQLSDVLDYHLYAAVKIGSKTIWATILTKWHLSSDKLTAW